MEGDVLDCSSAQTQEEIQESFIKNTAANQIFTRQLAVK